MTYDDRNRGTIQYTDRAKQLLVYDGMRFGNISPTDIDALIEYRNKAYIVYECKYRGAEMSRGQELALTRIVDDFQTAHKDALLIVCEHDIENPRENVVLANISVKGIYFKGKYHETNAKTVKDITESFLRYVDKKMPSAATDGGSHREQKGT